MSKRPLLAMAVFASIILSGTAAMACPWVDAQQSQNDPKVVASTDGSAQPDSQMSPSAQPSSN